MVRRQFMKVVARVQSWYAKDFRFVLIPDPNIHNDFEIYLAKRKNSKKSRQLSTASTDQSKEPAEDQT